MQSLLLVLVVLDVSTLVASIATALSVAAFNMGEYNSVVAIYSAWCLLIIRGALHPIACVWKSRPLRKGLKMAMLCRSVSNGGSDVGAEGVVVDHSQTPGGSQMILEQIWNTGRHAGRPSATLGETVAEDSM